MKTTGTTAKRMQEFRRRPSALLLRRKQTKSNSVACNSIFRSVFRVKVFSTICVDGCRKSLNPSLWRPLFGDDYYRETMSKLTRRGGAQGLVACPVRARPMWMVPAFGTVGVAILVVGLLFGKGNLS